MIQSTFEIHTKLWMGKKEEEKIGEILSAYPIRHLLIVCGKHSVRASGLLDRVCQRIEEQKIAYTLLEGIEPNPKISKVQEGIALVRKKKIDFLLAIGGGSVIDTTKLIAVAYDYEGDPFDFNRKKVEATHALPFGVILTISAAGSEMSTSCVISHEQTKEKRGFNSVYNQPQFAILNPELTYSVSPYQTACGIVDIMMHTLERYFNPSSPYEFADELALGLLKSVKQAGEKVMQDPNDYDARASLMLASSFSHNGITGIGKKTPMPVHQLEHALSGYYDFVAHGAGLAVLFPSWAMLYYKQDLPKFSRFAREVMQVQGIDDEETAYLGIIAIRSYFHRIGMPITWQELGILDPQIPILLDLLFQDREEIPSMKNSMNRVMAEKIYRLCQKEEWKDEEGK